MNELKNKMLLWKAAVRLNNYVWLLFHKVILQCDTTTLLQESCACLISIMIYVVEDPLYCQIGGS